MLNFIAPRNNKITQQQSLEGGVVLLTTLYDTLAGGNAQIGVGLVAENQWLLLKVYGNFEKCLSPEATKTMEISKQKQLSVFFQRLHWRQ